MTNNLRPVLCVVAGPNGSGKTSTTEKLLTNEWTSDCLYINPDNIAQDKFGDWNSVDAVIEAAEYATTLRYKCLEERKNFVFETVFSSQEKFDFLIAAKQAGFFVRFFFVCTEDPQINVKRVVQRYLNGGHEVPISKIFSRYYKSLQLAAKIIRVVDRAYVYDNSVDNELPRLLFRMVDGRIEKQYVDIFPGWAMAMI